MGNSNHKDRLPEHGIIRQYKEWDHENYRVLGRVQRNDPALKELTLDMPWNSITDAWILRAFDAIATHSSLEILNIEVHAGFLPRHKKDRVRRETKNRVKRALIRNTSLKQIRITNENPTIDDELSITLDIIMASPNLEALTLQHSHDDGSRVSIEDMTAMTQVVSMNSNLQSLTIKGFRMDAQQGVAFAAAFQGNKTIKTLTLQNSYYEGYRSFIQDITVITQVVSMNSNLQSLTIKGFRMDSQQGVAFAAAFQGNKTIKTLTMSWRCWIGLTGAVSFVEALPQGHSLKTIVFRAKAFDDDSAVSIVRSLCHTPLKVLLLKGRWFHREGCERIVQILSENEHSFAKLDLFPECEDVPWQNKIRLEIEKLTWKNRLQVEKDTWADRFLEHNNPSQELIFLALERAKKVDSIQFFKAPNMLFYLIKEIPDLIVAAIHDGH